MTRLRICLFHEGKRIDKALPLDALLETLDQVPILQYLEFNLRLGVEPSSLVSSDRAVALNRLTDLVFDCNDECPAVERILHHLVILPTARVTIELDVSNNPDMAVDDTSLTELVPIATNRYSFASWCDIRQAGEQSFFSIGNPLCGHGALLSIDTQGTFASTFIKTASHLPTFLIRHPALQRLKISFNTEIPLDDLTNALANIPRLGSLEFQFDPGAQFSLPRSRLQSSRANLTHAGKLDFTCDGPRPFSLVDRFLSSINISVDTKLTITIDKEIPRAVGTGRGLFEVPPLMTPTQQAFWCHVETSPDFCALLAITQRLAGADNSSQIPFFEVYMKDPSPEYTFETMHWLPAFLSPRPITQLWMSIVQLTRTGAQPSSFSWDDLLQSVPRLQELALCVDIWTSSGASSALVGSASELFGLLQTQSHDGRVLCPRLQRLWLVLEARSISVADCLRFIRNLVRFRYSVGVPIRRVHLAVDRERWAWESYRDRDVSRLWKEIAGYGVEFRVESKLREINLRKPSMLGSVMLPV